MNVESFVVQGQAELRLFYSPYFNTEAELETFLFDALDYENGSLEKRQMLYQVQRFVSLANDIDKLRPGRDCLRMLFIKICLESLCSLSRSVLHFTRNLSILSPSTLHPSNEMIPREPTGMVSKLRFSSRFTMK